MPLLTDIAKIQIGKQIVKDTRKGMYEIQQHFPLPEQSLTSRLRTSVTVGSENNLGKVSLPPSESKGTYASWLSEFERTPVYDLYESQPLNQIQDTEKQKLQEFILEKKHKEWLEEINSRIKKLRLKK